MSKIKTNVRTRVTKNGIVFFSNKRPVLGVEVFFDEEGKINSKFVLRNDLKVDDYLGILWEKGQKVNKKNLVVFNMVLLILSAIGCLFTQNFGLILAAMYFSVYVSIDIFNIIKFSYVIKCKEHSTAKFHASEHMMLNAYEKLQRVPTLEEAKKFSRFYKNCESAIPLAWCFIFSILTVAFASLFPYQIYIYFGLLLLLPILWPFSTFLQILVTSKPSDKEIKLAIEGLRLFEIMEESVDKEGVYEKLLNQI